MRQKELIKVVSGTAAAALLIGTALVLLTGIPADTANAAAETLSPEYGGANEPDNPNCAPWNQADYQYKHACSPPDPDGEGAERWNFHLWAPNDRGHNPGADNVRLGFRLWPVDKNFNLEYWEYITYRTGPSREGAWKTMEDCTLMDTRAGGIDRGNDGHGGAFHTTSGSEQEIVSSIQEASFSPEYAWFEFAGPDDTGREGVHLNHTDALVFSVKCYNMTNSEGWYRVKIGMNGTNYQGETIEWRGWSHWTWLCSDCKNRQDAREKFGPPGTDIGDDPYTDTTVNTADSTTPNATDSPGGGGETATDSPGGGGETATDSPGGGGETASPTEGQGQPGFGAVATVIALLAAALVARQLR